MLATLLGAGAGLAADNAPTANDLAQLRAQLAAQQAQIEQLRQELEQQKQPRANARPHPASLGQVASTAPVLPPAPPAAPQITPLRDPSSPLQLHIGNATITPVGFMDFTSMYRSKDGGSGIGTNFGSIPYANTVPGRLGEFRFSAQNSRVGLRVDAKVHGANVLGYFESDFLGFSPANAAVTSNSNNLRMRLYWVDVKKGKYEILGGQSWSLLTPNRTGLSPLPGDIFYSQDMDVNYQAGLVWSRNPGFRFVYHAAPAVSLGFAVEAAEQYVGGSAGGGLVTLPSAYATAYASQLNNGSNTFGVPNQRPDLIAKIAFDPVVSRRHLHIELAGVSSGFRLYDPLKQVRYGKQAGGGSLNFNLELVKNFHLISNNFYSDGGGRWIFGQGPDLVVRGDGTPSLVHASSTVSGFEYQARNTMFYAYYGGILLGRDVGTDPATGKFVGYGYPGSPNSQNRTIQEGTFGMINTFWKDPKYGALQMISQYSYLTRNPWYLATGQPPNANLHMIFVDLRYTLPGSAPAIE